MNSRAERSKVSKRPLPTHHNTFVDATSLFNEDPGKCSDDSKECAESTLETLHPAPDVFGLKGHGIQIYRERSLSSITAYSEFLRNFQRSPRTRDNSKASYQYSPTPARDNSEALLLSIPWDGGFVERMAVDDNSPRMEPSSSPINGRFVSTPARHPSCPHDGNLATIWSGQTLRPVLEASSSGELVQSPHSHSGVE